MIANLHPLRPRTAALVAAPAAALILLVVASSGAAGSPLPPSSSAVPPSTLEAAGPIWKLSVRLRLNGTAAIPIQVPVDAPSDGGGPGSMATAVLVVGLALVGIVWCSRAHPSRPRVRSF